MTDTGHKRGWAILTTVFGAVFLFALLEPRFSDAVVVKKSFTCIGVMAEAVDAGGVGDTLSIARGGIMMNFTR